MVMWRHIPRATASHEAVARGVRPRRRELKGSLSMDNTGAKLYGCDGEGAVATPGVARTNTETVATSSVALMK